jgi:hypothetical protein
MVLSAKRAEALNSFNTFVPATTLPNTVKPPSTESRKSVAGEIENHSDVAEALAAHLRHG